MSFADHLALTPDRARLRPLWPALAMAATAIATQAPFAEGGW